MKRPSLLPWIARRSGILVCVAAASGLMLSAAQAKNVAWISYHETDAASPAGMGATPPLTDASDKGYTDLITGAGHTVTRFLTMDNFDTSVLEPFDLIVISRSLVSGHFLEPEETAAWNGLTKPAMFLSGYLSRMNRLGMNTGNTIPDIGGDIRLTVTDTSHPIFAGIAFDAQKTTVNPYAGLVTFMDVVQRGISVVSEDPAPGATLLASVNAAGDPTDGGPIIYEIPAGTTSTDASADVFAGKRLAFLTGSREVDGQPVDTAGFMDLTADGQKMFVNAVNYMAGGSAPVQNANFDGKNGVDGHDFLIWQRGLGTGTTLAQGDADGNGAVNAADLAIWKSKFGTAAGGAAGAVPEPASAALALVALMGLAGLRRRSA